LEVSDLYCYWSYIHARTHVN